MWGHASSAVLRALSAMACRAFVAKSPKASAATSGHVTPTETQARPDDLLPLINSRAQRVCNRSRPLARKYLETHKALSGGDNAR